MSNKDLQEMLKAGDTQACLSFFSGMPEKQRREFAAECLAWCRKALKSDFIETEAGTWSQNPILPAARVAMFSTATLSEVTKLPWHARPGCDQVYEILLDRRPPWIDKWVLHLLADSRYWNDWALIRRLIRAGVAQKPDHPNYYLGMISGLTVRQDKQTTLEQRLLDDKELLREDIWKLFEYEGGGENSLANCDRFTRDDLWSGAMLSLAKKGRLSRDRLMECGLAALQRDFNHYRAKWFATFYDMLKPDGNEQKEHAETYLHLLRVTAPNIVSWAFKKVEGQAKLNSYSPSSLVTGIEPVLMSRTKGVVKRALKLLARTAKQDPAVSPAVALTAVTALGHEAVDVQEAALDVIDATGSEDDAQLLTAITGYKDLIAPSLRSRLGEWVPTQVNHRSSGKISNSANAEELASLDSEVQTLFSIPSILSQPERESYAIPAAIFNGTELPQLAVRQPVTPINDLDELIDVCARVIEDAASVDDIERAIDGLARLCGERPEGFDDRVGPLLKRIRQQIVNGSTPFVGEGPIADIGGLAHTMITQEAATLGTLSADRYQYVTATIDGETYKQFAGNMNKTLGFLTRRSYAIAMRIASGQPTSLLSTPTHEGAWIDPLVLADRVNAWTAQAPDITDVTLAMLRLAPENRGKALAKIEQFKEEWVQAIRYALGGDEKIGKSAALWVTASRVRSPWDADKKICKAFPKSGPDAGTPAVYNCSFKKGKYRTELIFPPDLQARGVDSNCVPLLLHAERGDSMWELGGIGGRTETSVRWTATAWPSARESFFAAASAHFAQNIDWWEAAWQNKALLEPLLDPGTPLREMGVMLLVMGLGAKEPGEYGLATDAAITAIEDGRLGSDNLGRMLAQLLPTGLIKPGRWQKTLGDVARVTPVHAATVKLGLEYCLAGNPADMPRDYGKLLSLLHELSVELDCGIAYEEHRIFLGSIKGTGKAAKSAKSLLALSREKSDGQMQQIIDQAVAMRFDAASKWT